MVLLKGVAAISKVSLMGSEVGWVEVEGLDGFSKGVPHFGV